MIATTAVTKQADVQKILAECKERVKNNPGSGKAYHELGAAFVACNNPEEAEACFKRARRLMATAQSKRKKGRT